MTEAMWVELIRVLPTLVWLGFAVVALVVGRRILTREAHRMTRVETPFVSVELAREVIEQAGYSMERHSEASHAGSACPSQAPDGPIASGDHPSGGGRPEDSEETAGAEARVGGETPPQPAMRPPIPPQRRFPESDAPSAAGTEPWSGPPQGAPMDLPYLHRPSLPDHSAGSPGGLRAATRLSQSTDLLQGGSVLWVDDHPDWNESLVRLFRTAGITVDTVDTGDEAMRAMMIAPYDLVISDMRRDNEAAGEAAGMALLDRMVSSGIPTPAIFFSGHAKALAALHPRAATATASPEELVNHVIDIVGHRRRRYGEGKPLRLPWGPRRPRP